MKMHSKKKNKSLPRPASTTSLTTLKLDETTSSATDDEEQVECDVTDISKKRSKLSNEKKDKNTDRMNSNDTEQNVIIYEGLSSNTDEPSIIPIHNKNPYNKEQSKKEKEPQKTINKGTHNDENVKKTTLSKKTRGFRFSKKERKHWKHSNEDDEQVRKSF